MNSTIKTALINASATAAYIILVASLLFYAGNAKWGQQTPTVLIPIFMLMLFVFSATVTATLMLGKPVLWYLEGKKKEALQLLGHTLGIFFIIIMVALGLLIGVYSK